jgi:membrane-bound lytic murein transglycosylase D
LLSLFAGLTLALAVHAAPSADLIAGGFGPQLKISHSLQLADPAISEQTDLWPRLRNGMALPDTDNALVQVHERWFSSHPEYLGRAIQRSRLYLFHIVEEVDKRGMPMEIALLPMIESGYDPRAQSPRQASGLWQFIPSTGHVFGLKQNAWYDGRRDVLQATRAALDYLEKLQDMFGDWRLALAAYNCGEGCVSRAIARNRAQGLATDYDHLSLPTETRHYVPKLLAVRNLILNPDRYNIALDTIPNSPYFMQVNLSQPMEAKTAAALAEMGMDEFLALNPAYRRKVIYTDTPGMLLIPADRIDTFHFNLQRTGKDNSYLRTYQAKRGESLQRIADSFNVSLQWLKDHNPVNLFRGKLTTTEKLVLPAPSSVAQVGAVSPKPIEQSKQPGKSVKSTPMARTHTVRKGDTLTKLARKYGVKLADLRQLNRSKRLMPGDTVILPEST